MRSKHPRPDPTTKDFRDLLNRFLDVCNAIAFAHSRGVLHRDLKPHNVMIGDYGEALIIDWGLAKATGRRDPASGERPEATLIPRSGSDIEPTQAGQAIGTPAYMSPEQACGDLAASGPATDVFGLGAILYHLVEEPVLKNNSALGELRKKLLKEPLRFFKSLREQLQADNETRPETLARLANAAHAYAHLTPGNRRYPEGEEKQKNSSPLAAHREGFFGTGVGG